MVYTVFYKTSSFAGYCFLDKNSIHPKRYGVFSFKAFIAVLVKIQICSFIIKRQKNGLNLLHNFAHYEMSRKSIELSTAPLSEPEASIKKNCRFS